MDTASTAAVTNLWTGDVTASTLTVAAKLAGSSSDVRLVCSPNADLSAPRYVSDPVASDGLYARATVAGLPAGSALHWGLAVGGVLYTNAASRGQAKTLPAALTSFRFAAASCFEGSTSAVMDQLRALANKPLFFIATGDLHYGDFVSKYGDVGLDDMFQGDRAEFLREVPTLYTWSDHDFLGDSSDAGYTAGGQTAATMQAVYRKRVPLPASAYFDTTAGTPVGWSKTVGRLRIVGPDQRSAKVNGGAMWGAAQKTWLLGQITAAKAAGQFVLLVSDVPLSGTEFTPAERTDLANHVKAQGMEGRVAILAGDAHSIFYDVNGDGHDYATGTGGRLPIIGLAPLAKPTASHKGSGYDVTPIPALGGGALSQAGYIDVTDDGANALTLAVTGIDGAGATVATFSVVLSLLPVNQTAPAITGSTAQGSTLTLSTGDWSGAGATSDLTYAYRWRRNGTLISGATASTFAIPVGEPVSNLIAGEVAATNGTGTSAYVAATGPVTVTAAGGSAVPTFTRATSTTNIVNTGAITRTATFPAAAAGSLLVLVASLDKSASAATPSGWTAEATMAHTTGGGVSGAVFWKIATGGETSVAVDITSGGGSTPTLTVMEFAGAHATAPLDAKALFNGNASTSREIGNSGAPFVLGTTGFANELAVAVFTNDSAASSDGATARAWGNGFAEVHNLGVGVASTESGAPAINVGTKAIAASATAVSTWFSYTGDTADETLGFGFTVRPA